MTDRHERAIIEVAPSTFLQNTRWAGYVQQQTLNVFRARARLFLVIAIIGLAAAAVPPTVLAAEPSKVGKRPNFVLIIADDQTYSDFGFMGSMHVVTPNLDALAQESARFVNGYVPTSVCRPSLVTLLTGLYPHQHGVFFNHPPPGLADMKGMTVAEWNAHRAAAEHFIRDVPSLPRVLAAHGYACLQTGKLWEGDFRNAGFTEGMTLNKRSPDPAYGNRQVKDGLVAHGNGDAGLNIGRDTMEPLFKFVREHKQQPILVWYAPMLPHAPFDAPERFRRPYENRPEIPPHMVGYYAEISRFDDTVGQLMKFMADEKLDANTIYVMVSDNGFQPSTKRNTTTGDESPDDRSKLSPFENGVRTPILVRWAGHVHPGLHERLVQSIDIVPTVFAAADLTKDARKLPGIDLMPAAIGAAPLPDRPAFGEIFPNDAKKLGDPEREVDFLWVRDKNLKLIERVRGNSKKGVSPADTTLFDLASDPEELHNLAALPQRADDVNRLRDLLRQWWPEGLSAPASVAPGR